MNQPESCRATDAPSADVLYAAVHILECPFGVDRPYHYYIPRPLADAVRPGRVCDGSLRKGEPEETRSGCRNLRSGGAFCTSGRVGSG